MKSPGFFKSVSILLMVALCILVLEDIGRADFTFGEPTDLRESFPFIDPTNDNIDCFSSDGLELYISSLRPGGFGDWDIYVIKRNSVDQDWGPLENLGSIVNNSKEDGTPSISTDGLTLYFYSNRPGGHGSYDIYVTTRPNRNVPWGQPMNLGPGVNSSRQDAFPYISWDGLELYFGSYRSGGFGDEDIYVTRRATKDAPWEEPVNLGPVVNSAYGEHFISLSRDSLLLIFSDHSRTTSPRPNGYGGPDMWMSRRASLTEPWEASVNMGPQVNGPMIDVVPRLSLDSSKLYFCTKNAADIWGYWQADVLPVTDFNGDGVCDAEDMCIMIDYWGTNETLCDIGPMPWGGWYRGCRGFKGLCRAFVRGVHAGRICGN